MLLQHGIALIMICCLCTSLYAWDGEDNTVFPLADKLANLIHQRFEFYNDVPRQFFLGVENMNKNAWDVLKYKFLEKISSKDRSQFLMIFGGSSVTQGSDNMFTSTFPMVFERRMKPILDALGVDLVVHNIAQSANQCIPSELCYNSMGGENADFIGWEQSFNCGRETSMFEVIARIAGFQKAVLHFAASGSESVDQCADSKTQPPRISEQWSPEVDEEIQADLKARGGARQRVLDDSGAATEHIPYTPYVPTKEAVNKFKDVLTHWGEKANSVSRFAGPLGSSYQRVGAHGFNIWADSRAVCHQRDRTACTALDMLGTCYDKGGPKWITHELSHYDDGKREYGHSHHPTSGWHLLRGEVLVYNYLHVLLDAVFTMQADIAADKEHRANNPKVKEPKDLHALYEGTLKQLQPAIPEKPMHTTLPDHAHTPPKCFTDFEPHYNPKFTLSEAVVGQHPGWEYHKGLPVKFKEKELFGYLDIRPGWIATPKVNSTLSVEVSLENGDKMMLCGYKHKDSLKHSHIFIDFDAAQFNSKEERDSYKFDPSGSKTHLWPKRSHIGGDTECTLLEQVPNGKHVVTVSTGDEHGHHADGKVHGSALTHIITY